MLNTDIRLIDIYTLKTTKEINRCLLLLGLIVATCLPTDSCLLNRHGNVTEMSRKCHGNVTERSRKGHGKVTERSRKGHGKPQ